MTLLAKYKNARTFTERLARPLSPEDCMVQSMDDVSPTRWHLAHTTWFFETFVLAEEPDYQCFDEQFGYLFNSYYNSVGQQFPRDRRSLISRPGLERILEYRQYVDKHLIERLSQPEFASKYKSLIEIGLQHEQQHQELILTDIKHVLSCNPTWPVYEDLPFDSTQRSVSANPIQIDEGVYDVGHSGDSFAFDNESPRHKVFIHATEFDSQLVTCGEYLEFMNDREYERPEYWLSAGWAAVNQQRWNSPMYWDCQDEKPMQFTLAGMKPVGMDAPVTHISFYEADAYARWRGKRLPTEFEWEVAAATTCINTDDPFVDWLSDQKLSIHPTRSPAGLCGSVWQWTSSSYLGYPGYQPPPGAVGEYNGKFMCDQHVLRGGSVATHSSHIRETYRNFFPAHVRWQFTGIRLAKEASCSNTDERK